MTEEEVYEKEIDKARRVQAAYDSFLKEFIEDKKIELFNRFSEANIISDDDVEVLKEIRRMCSVVSALEDEVLNIIQTGELAKKSLANRKKEK